MGEEVAGEGEEGRMCDIKVRKRERTGGEDGKGEGVKCMIGDQKTNEREGSTAERETMRRTDVCVYVYVYERMCVCVCEGADERGSVPRRGDRGSGPIAATYLYSGWV